jgi:hypothetical protein
MVENSRADGRRRPRCWYCYRRPASALPNLIRQPLFLSCPIRSTGRKARLRATPMPSSIGIPQSPVSISYWSSGTRTSIPTTVLSRGSRGLGGLAPGPNLIPKRRRRCRRAAVSLIRQTSPLRWPGRATLYRKSSAKAPPLPPLPSKIEVPPNPSRSHLGHEGRKGADQQVTRIVRGKIPDSRARAYAHAGGHDRVGPGQAIGWRA